jgi:hypothetical protein
MHMARGGGMHRGGRGDARASCASPLGTPLAPNFFKRLLLWHLICDDTAGQNLASSPCALNFAAGPLLRR